MAWEAECAGIEQRVGLTCIEGRCDRLDDRLKELTEKLADMTPSTLAGVVAKARAWIAINKNGAFADEWIEALHLAVLQDMIAIGGAA